MFKKSLILFFVFNENSMDFESERYQVCFFINITRTRIYSFDHQNQNEYLPKIKLDKLIELIFIFNKGLVLFDEDVSKYKEGNITENQFSERCNDVKKRSISLSKYIDGLQQIIDSK